MKKELDYFMIDGEFGGNQDWFTNIVMNVGGCGQQRPVTAVSIWQNTKE